MCLHMDADEMAPIGNKIVHPELYDIDAEQDHRPEHKEADLVVRDIHVEHAPRDRRIHKVAQSEDERAEHIRGEHLPLRLIIG